MAEWQDVEPVRGAAVTANDINEEVYSLLRYVYVIKEGEFVLKKDHTVHFADKEFNYQFVNEGKKLPTYTTTGRNGQQQTKRLTPSEYVRDRCGHSVTRIESDPRQAAVYTDDNGLKVLNIFPKNTPIPDVELPDPKPFLEHLKWLLNDNQGYADHVLKWMANILYRPDKRMDHGIVISGAHGSGKGTITKLLSRLMVPNASDKIRADLLVGRFQDFLKGKRFIDVDEAELFGSEKQFNKVKTFFTEERMRVDFKGSTSGTINNFCNFFFISNYADPLPLPKGDRRIFYVHSRYADEDPHILDEEYWNEFQNFLDLDGDMLGAFAVAKYLRDEVLPTLSKTFNTTRPPMTEDKQRMISSAKTTLEEYIEEGLQTKDGIFDPKQIYEWKLIKRTLDYDLQLKAKQEDSSIMITMGMRRKDSTIDGQRYELCWWTQDKEFDDEITKLRGDTTKEGRAKLKSYWKSRERQHLSVRNSYV
jgi:energy-coupling factor transporter ATP-binding protein EcfA2